MDHPCPIVGGVGDGVGVEVAVENLVGVAGACPEVEHRHPPGQQVRAALVQQLDRIAVQVEAVGGERPCPFRHHDHADDVILARLLVAAEAECAKRRRACRSRPRGSPS